MANIIDYLDWRGDLSFRKAPFNDVDNLILAELAYTRMEDIVPGPESEETVSIEKLCEEYERLEHSVKGNANNAFLMLAAAAVSERYRNVRVGGYMNIIDPKQEIQFSACRFFLDDGTEYVAFRGTDATIVGWREDFATTYLTETPGQTAAVRYLNASAVGSDCSLRVGGHSKGGNLAVYAAAFCEESVQRRILTVYSNDGPGFSEEIVNSEPFKRIEDRICDIIPESSMIGILMSDPRERQIIRSTASGIQQHNPYTWEVLGTKFVKADKQTGTSVFMDEMTDRWLHSLTLEERKNLVNSVFESIEASGAGTIAELNANPWESYTAIFRAVREMDPDKRKEALQSLARAFSAGKDTIAGSYDETVQKFMNSIRERFNRINRKKESE